MDPTYVGSCCTSSLGIYLLGMGVGAIASYIWAKTSYEDDLVRLRAKVEKSRNRVAGCTLDDDTLKREYGWRGDEVVSDVYKSDSKAHGDAVSPITASTYEGNDVGDEEVEKTEEDVRKMGIISA